MPWASIAAPFTPSRTQMVGWSIRRGTTYEGSKKLPSYLAYLIGVHLDERSRSFGIVNTAAIRSLWIAMPRCSGFRLARSCIMFGRKGVSSLLSRTCALIRQRHLQSSQGETGVRVLGRNREKARIALAKAHRDIRRKREWFLHDQSSHYTKHYALIGIEDWSTRDMTSSEPDENVKAPKHLLNRKILDVGWYELARQIDYKAEATGSQVVKVNPGIRDDKENVAGISKTCSGCGKALDVAASGNQYSLCDACNRSELGDVNAARNVLLRAILSKRETPTKREKTSIKIKGRTFRPKTSVKPIDEASGGDAPRRAPVDGGKAAREGGYPERTDKPQ